MTVMKLRVGAIVCGSICFTVSQCGVAAELPRSEAATLMVRGRVWTADRERPWAEAVRQEMRGQVRSCIDRLPEGHRTVLLLRDIEELDTDETARLLGIAPGAVKVRLHRARQALRTLLEPLFAQE